MNFKLLVKRLIEIKLLYLKGRAIRTSVPYVRKNWKKKKIQIKCDGAMGEEIK
jgi:hypothetical protein